jgi:D-aminopeptidase
MNRTTHHFKTVFILIILSLVLLSAVDKRRARDLGTKIGIFPTGEYNSITDVSGVKVGHTPVRQNDSNTRPNAISLDHSGVPYFYS